MDESEISIDNKEISTKINTVNIKKKGEENIGDYDKGTKLIIDNKEIKDLNEIQIQKKIKNKYILLEDKDKIHYIGIFFQGFVKEYFEHINKCKKIYNCAE